MEAQKWWDNLSIDQKTEMVAKHLSLNRTTNFITANDITNMYKSEKNM